MRRRATPVVVPPARLSPISLKPSYRLPALLACHLFHGPRSKQASCLFYGESIKFPRQRAVQTFPGFAADLPWPFRPVASSATADRPYRGRPSASPL